MLKVGRKILIEKKGLNNRNESEDRIYWNSRNMNKYDKSLATIIEARVRNHSNPKYRFVYVLDIDRTKVWSSDWLTDVETLNVPKYVVVTPSGLSAHDNLDKVKIDMALKLGEFKNDKVIQCYKLTPVIKIIKQTDSVKFTKL